jgi:hypothetical protein
MKQAAQLILLLLVLFLMQGCMSMYRTGNASIEVLQPGKVYLPENFKNPAIRYNNVNVSYNPDFAKYKLNEKTIADPANLDSIASWVYFGLFLENIEKQGFFESVSEIEPGNYSHTEIVDTISFPDLVKIDTTDNLDQLEGIVGTYALSQRISRIPPSATGKTEKKYLDSQRGLYTEEELKTIADTTGADFLLSLDHFSTNNIIYSTKGKEGYYNYKVTEKVDIRAFWTIYNLTDLRLIFYYAHDDDYSWEDYCDYEKQIEKTAPPRKDAVLTAADIKGTDFANFLIPHWTKVDRMYYKSGHVDLKKTDALIQEGKWMEAAAIWKANVDNRNKRISAKCMYNLALANEINGNMDAAIDWAVKSYQVWGEKNIEHAANCKLYISILSSRKLSFRILDKQLTD